MKLKLRKHATQVLTGAEARAYLDKHFFERSEATENHWATAVAVCRCGWFLPCIHGELAELEAEAHAG